MKYGKDYFKNLNYTDYLERRDKYLNHAKELHEFLGRLGLISEKSSIMDYGCAVGFLMEGFKELGYQNVYGYDISKWAVAQAKAKGLKILNHIDHQSFGVIICLDVFEHMTDREIHKVFNQYESNVMIVRIPCSSDGKRFMLNISNNDPTHSNLKTKNGWLKLLKKLGYTTILPLNLLTIYDTPGVMCALGLKPKAYLNHKSSL
ncbi:MAG: SAM-dependent methyltransferase [Candidatus Woesebacteria bacterium GW2011_GWB1_43_14]|uniref:SAM-dependent methyltransferase n=1 Tax=Candidatus Woesebacteria bacterium GW2011_GWB1_43_14 TaxID=1618578 RepID=A0A0G1DME5_9BACT|nr:MAG: SAM-dependent methyltransferase [Candidatus Woesebacteria bacterium GW2011_GWC1_42_9]KKS98809.1 MAG: SAM-dependent methyltransferase [Candidatus Woesebacteria bacterium GW2011_GWB1_43_14]